MRRYEEHPRHRTSGPSDLLELLAEGERTARLEGDQWVFEGTEKLFSKDAVRRLVPRYVDYFGAMTPPDECSIVFWITDEGKAALKTASRFAA